MPPAAAIASTRARTSSGNRTAIAGARPAPAAVTLRGRPARFLGAAPILFTISVARAMGFGLQNGRPDGKRTLVAGPDHSQPKQEATMAENTSSTLRLMPSPAAIPSSKDPTNPLRQRRLRKRRKSDPAGKTPAGKKLSKINADVTVAQPAASVVPAAAALSLPRPIAQPRTSPRASLSVRGHSLWGRSSAIPVPRGRSRTEPQRRASGLP